MNTSTNIQNLPTIYYDGECGVCNTFVQFLLKHDTHKALFFAALQGETAQQNIPAEIRNTVDSVVFIDADNKIYTKSSAALRVFATLGGIGKSALIFLIVPAFIRNAIYDFVARNRHKWIAKNSNCIVPTQEQKARFLS